MRKIILIIFFQSLCLTGFCQSLSLKNFGMPFQRAGLDVHWEAPPHSIPKRVWVYHLLPRTLSGKAISNLMVIGSFTEKDKRLLGTNGMLFTSPDHARTLLISYPSGIIRYETKQVYSPKNPIKGVPDEKKMLSLTTKLLAQLGISPSDMVKKETTSKPDFHFFDSQTIYFENQILTTNVEWRGVRFRRSIDGGLFVGAGTGGEGEIDFGENGKITKIDISWRNLDRYESYPTATPQTIIEWMRSGKAIQTSIPMSEPPIEWQKVKNITIKHANVSYYGGMPDTPSSWLIPLASLWATVDRGNGIIDVEIDCPIFEGGP